MRRWMIILFVLGIVCGAQAPPLHASGDAELRATLSGVLSEGGERQGGETIADAVNIPSMPFSDRGTTIGFLDNYDVPCPDSSWAPDIVYSFTPAADGNNVAVLYPVRIDLCSADYDTKVYIYQDDPENPVACNDDACGEGGTRSLIENLMLAPLHTYYIVIDGRGGASGGYEIEAVPEDPCMVCPPGAIQENEPPLSDDYVDHYNGGCTSNPPVFQRIEPPSGTCADVCGRTGTYQTATGTRHADTDWYDLVASGSQILVTVTGETGMHLFALAPTCDQFQVLAEGTSRPCLAGTISIPTVSGQHYWLWVGSQPTGFGIPECSYTLHVCGIRAGSQPPRGRAQDSPPDGTEKSTWGRIKSTYGDAAR